MNDTMTLRGFVATDVKTSTTPGGVPTASFRMGCTERRFDKALGVWMDVHTNWFAVQAYRQLAGNMGCSIKKGQRVIVVGRLELRSWEHEGRVYHASEIDAESLGHDLTWGTANYIRTVSAPTGDHSGTGDGTSEPGQVQVRDDEGTILNVNAETGEVDDAPDGEEQAGDQAQEHPASDREAA
ncbi:single-stranded DNA-binding protein [Pseudarthrobacter sp. PS3-L1]|uniref:single-stranded DNA-binding protein n=1 Tax=Pseudarthrobacter sp. PS3-L1 TaxID=3046207 RepID=UPI0024BA5370|nr:single-stranded DNA-binding protein [Pseudarthrobacter sp. PS3-L1]MDJ0319824.1 single-stranded DNA-binding protein [Pseudarthrobacter sp. PS3-L1]